MDASFTFLPVSAREYLHWLREAHFSSDNWLLFEHALDSLHRYSSAKAEADLSKQAKGAQHTDARRDLFIALARQIVAQEELRVAIGRCRQQCLDETLSSDAERFLAWLQARCNEAEIETRMDRLLQLHESRVESDILA